ncbi:uncharacterized protein LOC124533195 [Vanessa cardui]|uniref:uncharacterized protein LOC124533195 n=1 Tax=Vanessa cardui TaxID=171605 RepID=UPI001F145AB1|nr:uncharacterized protein LOC124533195 [Vanessa cardui]
MGRRRSLCMFLALSLLANALCLPSSLMRSKRQASPSNEISTSDSEANEVKLSSAPDSSLNTVNYDLPPSIPYNDDDDDDFDTPTTYPSDGGGSNIFSLLKLVTAFLPGSSTSSSSPDTTDEHAPSPLWTLKLDILRAILQFGTSILGVASSAVFSSSSAS